VVTDPLFYGARGENQNIKPATDPILSWSYSELDECLLHHFTLHILIFLSHLHRTLPKRPSHTDFPIICRPDTRSDIVC
jgi:hypothetical protein